ncbi:hypothetical protein C8R43DRAFT_962521 [Mycena crocata]|nr:hypothetical protein C8R43DRAFT_962521 [Mycena crocata]
MSSAPQPIILAGTLGLAVVSLLFGMCRTYLQILVTRQIKRAHTLYPLGSTLGPLISGFLSNLASKYPNYFGYSFLREYPYFIAGFICTLLAMLGFVMTYSSSRRFDIARMYIFCMGICPCVFLLAPFLNMIARAGLDMETGELKTSRSIVLWTGVAALQLIYTRRNMILVRSNTPISLALGPANGLNQLVMVLYVSAQRSLDWCLQPSALCQVLAERDGVVVQCSHSQWITTSSVGIFG